MPKVYPFTCSHCRDAPQRGQWRRSWRWKTQRGFDNHKCYADEQVVPIEPIHHPARGSGALPFWLEGGEALACPLCGEGICWSLPTTMVGEGETMPGVSFPCPHCNGAVQFVPTGEPSAIAGRECSICGSEMVRRSGKHGKFWGCSSYTRKNPCRGRAVFVDSFEVAYRMRLVPLTAGETAGYDCRDMEKVSLFAELAEKDEARKGY